MANASDLRRPVEPLEGMHTLPPAKRDRYRRIGRVLLTVGFVLFALPFLAIPLTMAVGMSGGSGATFRLLPLTFVGAFVGFVLVAVGGWFHRMGTMKYYADVVATETGAATQYSAQAYGRGIGQGLRDAGLGGPSVRLRCRSCGALDSEDARFCSACGKPM